ncbi:MAG TPA: phosphotransferase [Kineosporiaceae bacterium]|nr:phosphotransferase [Kineosporiaceae bacterium]
MTEPVTGAHDVAGLLASWLPRQRWFAAGPGGVTLAPAGRIILSAPTVTPFAVPDDSGLPVEPPVGIAVHIVSALPAGSVPESDGSASNRATPVTSSSSATYQVPLTYRTEPVPELAHALVGELRTADGPRWVYDAPHDPVFVAEWMRLVAAPDEAMSFPGTPRSRVRGVRRAGEAPLDLMDPTGSNRAAHVLSGEQSNTSIIVGDDEAGEPVMIKIFRVLQPGRNPDVVVPGALSTAGNARVPRLIGWIEGEWVQPDGQPAWGHLSAFAEFIAGSQDGWRIACAAIEGGETFAAMSEELGTTTAAVHSALARTLPTRPTTPAALAALADHLESRLGWAVDTVPALAEYAPAATEVIAAVRALQTAPDQQIVHGDYHLGQALYKADRGWVVLDFEGEPLRPLAERGEPDLALRDVAGMLRSFDYAARHSVLGLADDDPRALAASAWASECREAFLSGYAAESGRDPRQDDVLLRALELDKALYETVYETRHRPGWVEVPLRAVGRLLAARIATVRTSTAVR